jgi:hypothetical protein
MAVGAPGPSLIIRDFAAGHIACDVSSVFTNRVSHRPSAFFRVRNLTAIVAELTAVLHYGSLISCDIFLSVFL